MCATVDIRSPVFTPCPSMQAALNMPSSVATASAAAPVAMEDLDAGAPVATSVVARTALSSLLGQDMSLPPPDAEAASASSASEALAVPAVSMTSLGNLDASGKKSRRILDDACSRLLVKLLETVQMTLGLRVLNLVHYSSLLALLRYSFRRAAASKLLVSVLNAGKRVETSETVKRLCQALNPLLVDEADAPAGNPEDDPAVLKDLNNVARLINLIGGTTDENVLLIKLQPGAAVDVDVANHLTVYKTIMAFLSSGGARRVCHTFPPLVFGCLALARRALALDRLAIAKKVFVMVHEVGRARFASMWALVMRLLSLLRSIYRCAQASLRPTQNWRCIYLCTPP